MSQKLARYTCVLIFLTAGWSCFAASVASAPTDSAASFDRNQTILAKARRANEEIYTSLHSFICNEEMQRFKALAALDEGKQIDAVTATVSFENGTEQYTEVRQNDKPLPSIASVGGAWSEGEFGTLLRQTQALLSTDMPILEDYSDLAGTPVAIYQIHVTANESPWDLQVRSQHVRVPFNTKVWVSEADGEILKIERISTSIPSETGIAEIQWNVVLRQVELNGRTWLLPTTGEYSVSYKDSDHREWNMMQFSNYHRYSSEVAIRF